MAHRAWVFLGDHAVLLLVVLVLVQTTWFGLWFPHKDDFKHCVTNYVSALGTAQIPRGAANVALAEANKTYIDHPSESNRMAYDTAYDNYQTVVEKNPLPMLPGCFQ